MKAKTELDPVWGAVVSRLRQEGFATDDIFASMLNAAVAGLTIEVGINETAALTVAALRAVQPSAYIAA